MEIINIMTLLLIFILSLSILFIILYIKNIKDEQNYKKNNKSYVQTILDKHNNK